MTIGEAIKQQIKAAEAFEKSALEEGVSELTREGRKRVADEHRQIAEWLEELMKFRKLYRKIRLSSLFSNCDVDIDNFNYEERKRIMSKHLRWESHKGHWELLKEFYALNKYLITEQLKDTLLDAIECMEYTMTAEGEDYKEGSDNG